MWNRCMVSGRSCTATPAPSQLPARIRATVVDSHDDPGVQEERPASSLRQPQCLPVSDPFKLSDDENWSTPCASLTRNGRARSRSQSRQHGTSLRSTAAARGLADVLSASSSREDSRLRGSTTQLRDAYLQESQSSSTRSTPTGESREVSSTVHHQSLRRSSDRAGPDSDGGDSCGSGGVERRRRSRSRSTDGERSSAVAGDGTIGRTRNGRLQQRSTVNDASSHAERSQRRSTSAGRGQRSTAEAGDRRSTTLKHGADDGGSSRHSSSDGDGSSTGRGGTGGRQPPGRKGDKPESSRSDDRRRRRRSASRGRSRSPSRHKRINWIKPGTFDGSPCVETFLVKFEEAAAYNGWGVDDKLAHLYCSLTGPAEDLLFSTKGSLCRTDGATTPTLGDQGATRKIPSRTQVQAEEVY